MGNLNGLFNINIELTDRCNKSCWICGRRKRERENPDLELYYGDIDFGLLERISGEVPPGILVQFHNNGEGLLYPRFGDAVKLFKHCITNIVTNGILIYKKSDEIIDNLDTMSISIIEDDLFWQLQLYEIELFLQKKRDRKPFTTLRFVGIVDEERYKHLDLLKVRRILHSPDGSFDYTKRTTIPEHGICEDLLHHLAINRFGDVSLCVRFDPQKEIVLGNIREHTLEELWNSEKRLEIRKLHIAGKRCLVSFCNRCHFYGVPTGY